MSRLKRALLVAGVLAAGVIVTTLLIVMEKKPEMSPPITQAPIVDVINARSGPERVVVDAMGTVIPARELEVIPQVSGLIVEVNPRLVPGGLLEKGEVIARIEDTDYKAAKNQAWARVEEARSNLELEEGRQVVARREWELMERSEDESDLALRKPQLASAQARLNSAWAAYRLARLNLERCTIKAPLDAVVRREYAEVGQLVTPASRLATLAGSRKYWVRASVPVAHLRWLEFPETDGADGPGAKVIHEAGKGVTYSWEGRVIRLLGDLEPAGRMARVLVEVTDPLGQESGDNSSDLPLLIDSFVRVEIEGKIIENAFALPRTVLREEDMIWVVDENDMLDVRKPNIAWKRENEVLIVAGLKDGERVVNSSVPMPIPGVKLRVREGGPHRAGK